MEGMTTSAGAPDEVVAAQLRTAVFAHAGSERRRIFGPVLHVGVPGTDHLTTPAARAPGVDHSIRTDIVAAMLTAHHRKHPEQPGIAWLTRTGELSLHDADAAWWSPVAAACTEAGVPLVFAVVTKRGWWDPHSGVRRVWKRPRTR